MAYLGREVESQVAAVLVVAQQVLYQQGHLAGERDSNPVGKRLGLAEVDQVLEGEGKSDGLGQLDVDILAWLLDIAMRSKCHGTVANITVCRELDAILVCFDCYCGEISASIYMNRSRSVTGA